jgi:mRNA interferase HigB
MMNHSAWSEASILGWAPTRLFSQFGKMLVDFTTNHPQAKPSLEHWERLTKAASWASIQDITSVFSKSKGLNHERIRFEVQGGNYRLIVAFDFGRQAAFIKFIGTHAEYDRIDALTVSQF